MKKLLLTVVALVMLSSLIYAQEADKTIRLDRRFGVSLKVMGTTVPVGIAFDYFITSHLNAEVNFIYLSKSWHSLGGGLKFHFIGAREAVKWSPYIGIDFAYGTYDLEDVLDEKFWLYVPLGVNYIGDNGFNFAVDIGVLDADLKNIDPNDNLRIMLSLKIGHRFLN